MDKHIIFFLILCSAAITTTLANLKCFRCGLDEDQPCPEIDPEKKMEEIDCKDDHDACSVLWQRTDQNSVLRGCANASSMPQICEKFNKQMEELRNAGICEDCGYCGVCNTDLCNKDRMNDPLDEWPTSEQNEETEEPTETGTQCYICGIPGADRCPEDDPSKKDMAKGTCQLGCVENWGKGFGDKDYDKTVRGCEVTESQQVCDAFNGGVRYMKNSGLCTEGCDGDCVVCKTNLCNLQRSEKEEKEKKVNESSGSFGILPVGQMALFFCGVALFWRRNL